MIPKELKEIRKEMFGEMEKRLNEINSPEDDLFYHHSSEDRIVLSHAILTYGSFCRIECAPIPYKHRHSERFKVLSCKIELFNSSIGHFAG